MATPTVPCLKLEAIAHMVLLLSQYKVSVTEDNHCSRPVTQPQVSIMAPPHEFTIPPYSSLAREGC